MYPQIVNMIQPIKYSEIFPNTQESKPYPNPQYVSGENRKIKSCVKIKVDSKMLDLASAVFQVWGINKEQLIQTIEIAIDIVNPNSFLQDFVVDEKHN